MLCFSGTVTHSVDCVDCVSQWDCGFMTLTSCGCRCATTRCLTEREVHLGCTNWPLSSQNLPAFPLPSVLACSSMQLCLAIYPRVGFSNCSPHPCRENFHHHTIANFETYSSAVHVVRSLVCRACCLVISSDLPPKGRDYRHVPQCLP